MNITLQKWGNSQGIRIPKYILDSIKWKLNEELEIYFEDGKIIIEKQENHKKNINELFAKYDEEYIETDVYWGVPVGEELW